MNTFEFIPAIKFDTVFSGSKCVTFFGNSGHYFLKNGTYYIVWDGCHVANKTGSIITYNSKAHLPRGFKAAIKTYCA